MRRVRRVIAFLPILCLAGFLQAQQAPSPSEASVDTDLTFTGRDDSIIPVPGPEGGSDELVLPLIDPGEPDAVYVPPVLPPVIDSLMLTPVEVRQRAGAPLPDLQ